MQFGWLVTTLSCLVQGEIAARITETLETVRALVECSSSPSGPSNHVIVSGVDSVEIRVASNGVLRQYWNSWCWSISQMADWSGDLCELLRVLSLLPAACVFVVWALPLLFVASFCSTTQVPALTHFGFASLWVVYDLEFILVWHYYYITFFAVRCYLTVGLSRSCSYTYSWCWLGSGRCWIRLVGGQL